MIKSSNPALGEKTFENLQPALAAEGRMTINGAINKTLILLVLTLVPAAWVWDKFYKGGAETVGSWIMIAVIAGLVVAMATIFKKTWAPFTAPLYAVIEGVVIGGISAIAEAQFQGIVFQAASLTFGTLLALLVAYRTGVIKVTERFRLGVVAATGGIFVVYLLSIVLGFFGVNVPFIHSGGTIGILFSLFVVVIAALNLVLDFDFIERGAAEGAPKYMEWYGAFGLIVTLIWLYIEFLRLLTKLRQ
ncbi:MAG: Bax inhibitor-1/YccA family protein [Candidatus Dadabacteria bacterium]|nr:Bax inhibitor-1/YccA family protein [Candidatus Dadabacteria bacterium]